MGTVAIGIGIGITIGIGVGSVETLLHIIIEPNFIGIGIRIGIGMGIGQWKHTIKPFFLRRVSGERGVGRSERLPADVRASDVPGVPAVPRDSRPHGVSDHGRVAASRDPGRHHQRGRPDGQQRTLVR